MSGSAMFQLKSSAMMLATMLLTAGFVNAQLAKATEISSQVQIPSGQSRVPGFVQKEDNSCQTRSTDGRIPSLEYKQEIAVRSADWFSKLRDEPWIITYSDLKAELSENPSTPLPQYIRISRDGLYLTIGMGQKINVDMTTAQVQEIIEFVANDGFPIAEISDEYWQVKASTPSSHQEKGIQVTKFGDGKMTLVISPELFAIYGRDTRVVPKADALMPKFAYFQNRYPFKAEITLEMTIDGLKPERKTMATNKIWQKSNGNPGPRQSAAETVRTFGPIFPAHR